MLSLIIAESALELVPKEMYRHPSVAMHAKKLGKNPQEILLDNSWHFAAMKGIKNENKRGRPDLAHFALLEATSIPLYMENEIRIYVHTVNDMVISVGEQVRLPKSFHRFAGLIEKLYAQRVVKTGGKKLLEVQKMDFASLVDKIDPEKIIGLSTAGDPSTYGAVASYLDDACLVVGGFQKGHFSDSITKKIGGLYSIEDRPLEAHVVLGRILYEYEKTIFM